MSDDFDEIDRRIAAALYVPPFAKGKRRKRAVRMRDIILALMHAYGVPALPGGYMLFDFGFFDANLGPPHPLNDSSDHPFRMQVWTDDHKVLDLRWNEDDDVNLKTFRPSWWERAIGDINFWDDRVRWKPAPGWLQLAEGAPESMDLSGANLAGLRSAMQALRQKSLSFAEAQMRGFYAIGDRERGLKWESLAIAIDQGGAPLTSDLLN